MMAIPRLPADATPLSVTLNINENLRPYFTVWFQRKKLDGETPETFAIRILKSAALNDYLADAGKTEMDSVEAAKTASLQALQDDAQALDVEIT